MVMLGEQFSGSRDTRVASRVTSQPGGQLIQRGGDHDLNALGSVGGPVLAGIAPDRPVRVRGPDRLQAGHGSTVSAVSSLSASSSAVRATMHRTWRPSSLLRIADQTPRSSSWIC